jgi:hypothetical protein
VLKHLVDDCAKTKDMWKPPATGKTTGKKSFEEGVKAAAASNLAKGRRNIN